MIRWLSIFTLVLFVPIVPFLLCHDQLERWASGILQRLPGQATIVALVFGLLATDVFLPVPSSLVSTLAGGQLPTALATVASWCGMNVGAILGFAVGRLCGRPLAARLSSAEDLQRMESYAARHGPMALVLTRALPILAEACVLMLGVQQLSWRSFLPPVIVSNLGIAIAYSMLGSYAAEHEWLPVAMSIAIALPLLIALAVRRKMKRSE